ILSSVILLVIVSLLFQVWWDAERRSKNYQSLVWSVTITWSLVVNAYIGICDATLLVVSAILTAHFLLVRYRESEEPLDPAFKIILLLVYIVPWITQPIAKFTGVQIFTLVLALLGGYQFYLLHEINKQSPAFSEKSLEGQ